MGVPRFFSFLRDQPDFRQALLRDNPGNIDFFYIDGNGLLHTVIGQEFNIEAIRQSGVLVVSQEELIQRRYGVYRRFWDAIIALVQTVRPRRTLGLMIDGVGPQAKINQQRGRRYKSAAARKPESVFDTNSVTPGTEFMFGLDQFIRRELERINGLSEQQRRFDPYARHLPPTIVYSSHLVPGEGEHKIADAMRDTPATGQTAVVHGMDADLIMIFLMRLKQGWKNIYLFRENTLNYQVDTMIDLQVLNRAINTLYTGVAEPIDDFVAVLFLIGNDFLPHFPVFERTHDALSTLIAGYRDFIRDTQTPGLTTGSGINWQQYGAFLQYITDRYYNELLKRWGLNEDALIKFPSLIAQRCIVSSRQVVGITPVCNRTFDVERFKDEWYKWVFSPKDGSSVVQPTPEDINAMLKSYLEGIAWIYHYYRGGVSGVNVSWYYPYHYTPIFSDLAQHILRGPIDWEVNPIYLRSEFVNPLVQLAMVLPPKSLLTVPASIRPLYSEQSEIYDLYPETFLVDNQGKMEEWEEIAILPFPIRDRVIRAVASLGLPPDYMTVYQPQRNYVLTTNIEAAFQVFRGGDRGRGRGGDRGRGRGGDRGRGRGGDRGRGRGRGGSSPQRGRGGRGRGATNTVPVQTEAQRLTAARQALI